MTSILVVDDHDDIRELLVKRLQQRGFAVIPVSNGAEAVLAASSAQPMLILMDLNMPELDGIEATLQIRQQDETSQVPIIALTAHALPGDEERALAAGCNAFHSKPIDFEKLFKQIENLIEATSSRPPAPDEP